MLNHPPEGLQSTKSTPKLSADSLAFLLLYENGKFALFLFVPTFIWNYWPCLLVPALLYFFRGCWIGFPRDTLRRSRFYWTCFFVQSLNNLQTESKQNFKTRITTNNWVPHLTLHIFYLRLNIIMCFHTTSFHSFLMVYPSAPASEIFSWKRFSGGANDGGGGKHNEIMIFLYSLSFQKSCF